MKKSNYFSLQFKNDKLIFLDQTKLPFEQSYVETDDYERIAEAIEKLEIRGAPAIGIAATYALALSIKKCSKQSFEFEFYKAFKDYQNTPNSSESFLCIEQMRNLLMRIKMQIILHIIEE
jgi:methylthioribose-1-phosphate isomerase